MSVLLNTPLTNTINIMSINKIKAAGIEDRLMIALVEKRKAKGISQAKMAKKLDFNRSTLSRIESGKRSYSGAFVELYVKELECNLSFQENIF